MVFRIILFIYSFIRYSGATSLFMTVLLNKKYSLPYVLLDALVAHFLSFLQDDRDLPVLWQQVSNTWYYNYQIMINSFVGIVNVCAALQNGIDGRTEREFETSFKEAFPPSDYSRNSSWTVFYCQPRRKCWYGYGVALTFYYELDLFVS